MKDKVKIADAASEDEHQANLINWTMLSRGKYPELALLFHVPNEGNRSKAEAARMKRLGVKSGVPDLFLPVARRGYHGLFIEMKTEKGRPSENQKWWGNKLSEQGYRWQICYGWEDAVTTLEWYLHKEDGNAD